MVLLLTHGEMERNVAVCYVESVFDFQYIRSYRFSPMSNGVSLSHTDNPKQHHYNTHNYMHASNIKC